MDKYNIIIDTDIGDDIDDAMAIAYAAMHPRINLLGLTTVFWDPDKRCSLVLELLKQLGVKNIPCHSGFAKPKGSSIWDGGESQEYWGNQFPFIQTTYKENFRDAIEYIIDTVMNSTLPVTLVGIAPATNIAEAIITEPRIAEKLEGLVLMGGNVEGNEAEYNLCRDIKAYDIVFKTDIALTLAPLEITKQLYDKNFKEKLNFTGKNGQVLTELYNFWEPYKKDKPDAVLYDLATVMLLTKPELFTVETVNLALNTETGLLEEKRDGKEIKYIRDIDITAFFDEFFESIS